MTVVTSSSSLFTVAFKFIYFHAKRKRTGGWKAEKGTFPGSDAITKWCNKHKHIVQLIVLIHNFHTEIVGFSQIRTVFDLEYEHIQVLSGYDHIRQYYFCPGKYNSSDEEDDESE